MLPDLRIVIAAVLSTFVLTVGVGFYASSRLINEPKKRPDSLAAVEESPINRIALSWPEPAHQTEPLALDFAVTARALRNPVRDVTHETAAMETQQAPQDQPARISATDITPLPALQTPVKIESAPIPPIVSAPPPEPDIRIAVQYPPVPELPLELRAPPPVPAPAPAEPTAPAAPPQAAELPVTTGSIASEPAAPEPESEAAQPDRAPSEPEVASRPADADAVTNDRQKLQQTETVKPAAKAARKKAAPKKPATKAAKAPKRPVRRAAPRTADTTPAFFNFFSLPN